MRTPFRLTVTAVLRLSAFSLLLPGAISAAPITDFVGFGGDQVTLAGNVTVNSGLLGSNANMSIGSGADTLTVTGAGIVTVAGNAQILSSGDVIFNGNVSLGSGSLVEGDVHSGGNVSTAGNAVVKGNIYAAGTVSLGSDATVEGNVDAGFAGPGVAITLAGNADILGVATHKTGTTISLGSGATVFSDVIGTPTAPTPYAPTTIPGATPGIVSGGASHSLGAGSTLTLAPGSYNDISLGGNSFLNLSSGTYYFDTWGLASGTDINFDLTGGDIFLYFTGNAALAGNVDIGLVGGTAQNIYLETLGSFSAGSGSDWHGSVFASGANSDITFAGNTTIVGTLWARDELDIGSGSNWTYSLSNNLQPPTPPDPAPGIPEPAPIALLALALLGMIGVRRYRKV